MSRHAERIAELSRRVTGIELKLRGIDEQRAASAIEASQGGKTALRKIAELDQQAGELRRAKSTLISAADQLDAQLKQEEAAAAATARTEREAEAKRIGAAVCALNCEIDLAMKQLREAFERREHLISELRSAGGLDSHAQFALLSKEGGTSALRHAGLSRYISIEPVPVNNIRPLTTSNSGLPH